MMLCESLHFWFPIFSSLKLENKAKEFSNTSMHSEWISYYFSVLIPMSPPNFETILVIHNTRISKANIIGIF